MNALTTTTGTPAASGAMALIPRTMRDAMELASMMAKTGFLPKEIQNPGGALFVMEQAMRWNMSPFSVATEVSFISGKPMFSGKIVAAAVQSSGVLTSRLSYDYEGEGQNRTVIVRGTLRGETEAREVAVRLADAKTNNQHWTKSPDQMLAYHGARVWARRHAPEVMLGVYSPEEFDEPQAAPPREVPNLAQEPMRAPAGSMREVAAEIVGRATQAPEPEEMLPLVGPDGVERQIGKSRTGAPAAVVWGKSCEKAVGMLEDGAALVAWREANEAHFAAVEALHPEVVAAVRLAVETRLDEIAAGEPFPGDMPSAAE